MAILLSGDIEKDKTIEIIDKHFSQWKPKKVKKENVTPENIGEIILCQIPGISSITAMAIMSNFDSFNHFINKLQTNPQCIDNLTVTTNGKTRKINKTSIENIRHYLLYSKPSQADET